MLLTHSTAAVLGFLVNAFLGRRLPKSVSGGVACLAIIGSFVVSVLSVISIAVGHDVPFVEATAFSWMASGDLQIPLQLRLDHLSSLMILVVTGIGSLIHIYSTGYMHEESDSEYARYFSYLNLFAAFMLVLVLGANFPVMFVGWEGRRPLLLPADRLLVQEEVGRRRRQEGVHRQPHRRLRLHPRHAADLHDLRHARLPGGRGRGGRGARRRRPAWAC